MCAGCRGGSSEAWRHLRGHPEGEERVPGPVACWAEGTAPALSSPCYTQPGPHRANTGPPNPTFLTLGPCLGHRIPPWAPALTHARSTGGLRARGPQRPGGLRGRAWGAVQGLGGCAGLGGLCRALQRRTWRPSPTPSFCFSREVGGLLFRWVSLCSTVGTPFSSQKNTLLAKQSECGPIGPQIPSWQFLVEAAKGGELQHKGT